MAGVSSEAKPKIVVTRDMSPDANALLESSEQWPSLEIHRWEEDRPPPRDWFLQSVSSATALLITLCDKARLLLNWGDPSNKNLIGLALPQVDEELLRAGKHGVV